MAHSQATGAGAGLKQCPFQSYLTTNGPRMRAMMVGLGAHSQNPSCIISEATEMAFARHWAILLPAKAFPNPDVHLWFGSTWCFMCTWQLEPLIQQKYGIARPQPQSLPMLSQPRFPTENCSRQACDQSFYGRLMNPLITQANEWVIQETRQPLPHPSLPYVQTQCPSGGRDTLLLTRLPGVMRMGPRSRVLLIF